MMISHLTPGLCHYLEDFLEMVHVQYNAQVIDWMSDAGREYKSEHAEWPCRVIRVHSHGKIRVNAPSGLHP